MNETNPNEFQPTPELVVVRAQPEDAEAIRNIQATTWIDTYPNKDAGITEGDIRERVGIDNPEVNQRRIANWLKGINDPDRNIFVAKIEGKVVGFVASGVLEGKNRLGALYVLPEAQGKGAGKLLMQKTLELNGDKDLYLHVASYNQKAIDFYKKFGFKGTGHKVTDEVAKLRHGKEIPEIEMVWQSNKGS